MADINTVKNWFKTGLKPTQAQFWALFDSIFFKGEKIPVADIEGIEEILNDKADADALANHLTDSQAHQELLSGKADADALANHLTDSQAHQELLSGKADADALANHLTDSQAHQELLSSFVNKSYVDSLVVGLLDDRGNYNPATNTNRYPTTGGSGTAGVILKGDLWSINGLAVNQSTAIGTKTVTNGDVVRALIDNAAQVDSNWVITENNFGYTAENTANKSTSPLDFESAVKYPVWAAVVTYFTNLLSAFKTNNFLDATSSIQFQLNNKQGSLGFLPDNPNIKNETLITTGGNKNNEATPTVFLRYSNMVTPTIISGFANPVDGKVVRIYNNTLQNISVLHNSGASIVTNRLHNTNNQDLFVVVGGAAEYVYSATLSRWLLFNIWATDYFASLIGTTKRAMSVTPLGMAVTDEIIELEVYDLAKTTAHTKASINAAFPLITKGQMVVCPNITTGGITYKKYDDSTNDWLSIITPKLT